MFYHDHGQEIEGGPGAREKLGKNKEIQSRVMPEGWDLRGQGKGRG